MKREVGVSLTMGSNHVQAVLNSGYLVSFCYSFVCFVKKEGSLVPCAVKSLHDQSGLKERVEFLREAALMEGIRSNTVLVSSLVRTD